VDEGLKRRLVGAAVLVSLAVIFLPMLLEEEPVVSTGITKSNIPPRPEGSFSSRVRPLQTREQPVKADSDDRPAAVPGVVGEISRGGSTPPAPKSAAPKIPDKPRVGINTWVVQAGSFSNRDNAQKLVDELQAKKFAAFLEQAEVKGKTVFRVRVGPEIDRKRAEQLLSRLAGELKARNLSGKVASYP
jgi:DedD protein